MKKIMKILDTLQLGLLVILWMSAIPSKDWRTVSAALGMALLILFFNITVFAKKDEKTK